VRLRDAGAGSLDILKATQGGVIDDITPYLMLGKPK
jgi:hypothetical protein